jgi:RNA polymerase sigma-70 factor (ECF subfamily)
MKGMLLRHTNLPANQPFGKYTKGAMLQIERHRELVVEEPALGGPDGREAPHAPLSDGALVVLLREQPDIGAAQLYDRYGRLVYSVALRILHDHGAAEEVTQDVFVRCWRSIDRYQPERVRLVSWLLAIAHHRAIDELRSRRGKSQRREISADQLHLVSADDPPFDDLLLRGEIRVALAALPQPQREVIEQIFWGGLTCREAAAQLTVPLGTVHTRLRLGMNKLRGLLGQLFGEETNY